MLRLGGQFLIVVTFGTFSISSTCFKTTSFLN
ncbi:hypothetical protein JOC83_000989 [Bacillus iocasae]|uniref:Uncharacterized protein n=1 Tax=Priestia iocasae TaxID=2291674 RepID=A0ABS2QRS6_9BACI|nr:hypothetical protein [Metabacillus iocasae]